MAMWQLSKKSETWRVNPQNKKKTFVIKYENFNADSKYIYFYPKYLAIIEISTKS